MRRTIESIFENECFSGKIELPSLRGEKAIYCDYLCILTKKLVEGESVKKARFLYKNHEMSGEGAIFDDIYAPVVDAVSKRMFFAVTVMRNYHMLGFDVKTAFLYADINLVHKIA